MSTTRTAAGRKRAATHTVTVPIRIAAEAAEEAPSRFSGVPLFEQLAGDVSERIDKVQINRTAPIEEGHLGYLEPDASEDDIAAQHGGGTYRLQAKTVMGKPLVGGFRTVKIAGEPKFGNALSLARWRRIKRQEAQLDSDEDPDVQDRHRQPSIVEAMALQETRAEKTRAQAREDYERRESERDANHQREMARMRLEAEGREQLRRSEDERRDRERMAADERQRRDHEAAQARDREFFAGMLRLQSETKGKTGGLGETLELLAAARELVGGGADGASDPTTALINSLPGMLAGVGNLASQLGDSRPAAAAPAAGPNGAPRKREPSITLTGTHALRLAQAVSAIRARGLDPQAELLRMFEAAGGGAGAQEGQQEASPQGEPAEVQPSSEKKQTGQAAAARARAPRPTRVTVRRPAPHRRGR